MSFVKKIVTAIQKFSRGKDTMNTKKEVKTHDFTNQRWGNAFYYKVLDEGMTLDGHGFRRGIEVGDYVIIRKKDGNTTRYKVDKIRYCTDPSDMWFGTLSFAPRTFTPDGKQVGE